MPQLYTILLAPNPSLMSGPGTNTIILGGGSEGAVVIDPGDDCFETQVDLRCRSEGGIVRPRAFAVLRLLTSSNLVGC